MPRHAVVEVVESDFGPIGMQLSEPLEAVDHLDELDHGLVFMYAGFGEILPLANSQCRASVGWGPGLESVDQGVEGRSLIRRAATSSWGSARESGAVVSRPHEVRVVARRIDDRVEDSAWSPVGLKLGLVEDVRSDVAELASNQDGRGVVGRLAALLEEKTAPPTKPVDAARTSSARADHRRLVAFLLYDGVVVVENRP